MIYVCRSPLLRPIIQKGFASDEIDAEESQISQPWQLCLLEGMKVRDQAGFLAGGGGESVKGGGIMSTQGSAHHPYAYIYIAESKNFRNKFSRSVDCNLARNLIIKQSPKAIIEDKS